MSEADIAVPLAQLGRHYAVFISYRHADNKEMGRKWANWLHEALESYEVPRDLIASINQRGDKVPAALYPVFRDEEELPADADLSLNIRRALENSGLLVVLCSPRAVQSRFVADEIRYFKELGKSQRILALVIDGEPNASDDPGKIEQFGAAAECFPEPLRYGVPAGDDAKRIDWTARTEPIAADVRPAGRPEQGWTTAAAYQEQLAKAKPSAEARIKDAVREYGERLELAKLKIIAGALGLPLGVLTQRDKAHRLRKFRRLAMMLGSLAVVAMVAAVLALWQWRRADGETKLKQSALDEKQKEFERAEKARDQAEDILQYLIGGLRNKLATKASLAVLEDVENQVDKYYASLGVDESNAKQLDHRARAFLNKGDTKKGEGLLNEAMAYYMKYFSLTKLLSEREPENTRWQRNLSVVLDRIGAVQQDQDGLVGAEHSYRDSILIMRELLKKDPDNGEWRSALGISLCHLGNLQYRKKDWTGATQSYGEYNGIMEGLVEQNSKQLDWLRELGASYDNLGRTQKEQGDLAAALSSYEKAIEAQSTLVGKDPDNTDWLRDLAGSVGFVGEIRQSRRDWKGAAESYQESIGMLEHLAEMDPQNVKFQRELGANFSRLGEVQEAQGDKAAAAKSYQRFNEAMKGLWGTDPKNPDWLRGLAISFDKMAKIQATLGDRAGAVRSFEQEVGTLQTLSGLDAENLDVLKDLRKAVNGAGSNRQAQKDFEGALRSYRAGLEIAQRLADKEPEKSEWQRALIEDLNQICFVQRVGGHAAEAVPNVQRSMKITQHLLAGDPDNAEYQRDLCSSYTTSSQLQDALGNREQAETDLAQALEIVTRLKSSGKLPHEWDTVVKTLGDRLAALRAKRAQGNGGAPAK